MSVFVDTSGLYALLVRSEDGHEEMVRAFGEVLQGGRPLCATSYVLVETIALLQHRIGLAAVRDLLDRVAPLLEIEWVSQELHSSGVDRMLREDRRTLSLVDCVSLEFMRARGIDEVLGTDPHFAEAGYRLLRRS